MQLFLGSLEGEIIRLEASEAHHLFKVLRKSPGDVIQAIVNDGHFYEATLIEVTKKGALAKINSSRIDPTDLNYKLNMYVAPTKNIDRFEWFLEKATEIGLTSVTPILCERSERKVVKPERLQKIVLSATKQSLKARLPLLHPMVSFQEAIKGVNEGYIAHCEHGAKEHLMKVKNTSNTWNVFIGPEGDFSPKEIQMANDKQLSNISLGESRLRTETAALLAVTALNLRFITS